MGTSGIVNGQPFGQGGATDPRRPRSASTERNLVTHEPLYATTTLMKRPAVQDGLSWELRCVGFPPSSRKYPGEVVLAGDFTMAVARHPVVTPVPWEAQEGTPVDGPEGTHSGVRLDSPFGSCGTPLAWKCVWNRTLFDRVLSPASPAHVDAAIKSTIPIRWRIVVLGVLIEWPPSAPIAPRGGDLNQSIRRTATVLGSRYGRRNCMRAAG